MPARLRDLRRVLARLGIELENPSGGDHFKFRRGSERPYPVPASNGERTELDDKYIRGVCRHFGLDPQAIKRDL